MISFREISLDNYMSTVAINPGKKNTKYVYPIWQAIIANNYEKNNDIIRSIYFNNNLIGFVSLLTHIEPIFIDLFVIEYTYQNQGYGTISLLFLLQFIKNKGFDKCFVSTANPIALKTFIKCGFEKNISNKSKRFDEIYNETLLEYNFTI